MNVDGGGAPKAPWRGWLLGIAVAGACGGVLWRAWDVGSAAPVRRPFLPHVVKRGETLWSIAGEELGDPLRWHELAAPPRCCDDPALLRPGDVVMFPVR